VGIVHPQVAALPAGWNAQHDGSLRSGGRSGSGSRMN
jgi:uncharacterized protein YbdZ (MbtH family)